MVGLSKYSFPLRNGPNLKSVNKLKNEHTVCVNSKLAGQPHTLLNTEVHKWPRPLTVACESKSKIIFEN